MKRFQKYEKTIKVLSALSETAKSVGELTGLINNLPGPYYKSFLPKEEYRERMKRHRQDQNEIFQKEQGRKEKKKTQDLINKLQQDGLVENDGRRSFWRSTKSGLKKLLILKNKVFLPSYRYKTTSKRELIIIVFDVPEKERNKRDWLRDSLKELDCEMLQESVWVSKHKLPILFIEDLRKHKIAQYIKIFSIQKEGNIKEKDI